MSFVSFMKAVKNFYYWEWVIRNFLLAVQYLIMWSGFISHTSILFEPYWIIIGVICVFYEWYFSTIFHTVFHEFLAIQFLAASIQLAVFFSFLIKHHRLLSNGFNPVYFLPFYINLPSSSRAPVFVSPEFC